MYCKNCGSELTHGATRCENCGNLVLTEKDNPKDKEGIRFLPSFILGIVGSVFGFCGGMCATMCDFWGNGVAPFVFIVGGSLVGMVGACMCLNKTKIGSVLLFVSAIMMFYDAYDSGAGLLTVFGMWMILAAGIMGAIYAFIFKR